MKINPVKTVQVATKFAKSTLAIGSKLHEECDKLCEQVVKTGFDAAARAAEATAKIFSGNSDK